MKCHYHACSENSHTCGVFCYDHEAFWAYKCNVDYQIVSGIGEAHGHRAFENRQFSVRWSAMIDLVLELES